MESWFLFNPLSSSFLHPTQDANSVLVTHCMHHTVRICHVVLHIAIKLRMISYNFPAVEFFPRSHHPLLCHRYFRHLAVGFSIQECISFLFSLCFPLSGFLKHTTCKVGRFIKYLYGKHAINDSSVFIKQFIGFFPRFNSLFRKKNVWT